MTKKEYLIKLLTALEGKWPMAAGLKLLIEYNTLNDQTIDALQHIFVESIKFVNDQESQNALQKSHDFLQKLKERERLHKEGEEVELDEMLENI
ncbi:MAG: hypothetical protein PHR61_02800 [Candidatus Absconditabacteria bacterium]|nr:hypothetical protein [Candidatus Absconditabacteria bacterium]